MPALARSSTVWAVVIAALLTAGGILLLGRGTPPVYVLSCDPSSLPPTPQSPIHHLFVIIKENHAFENYFGAYPHVVGNPPNGTFLTSFGSNATIQPFALNGSSTADLPHDHASEVVDEDNGRNDLFVAQATASGSAEPSAAVGYYGEAAVPQYYAYARAYALGDRFFSGYLGPTAPNRDFDLAATTDGQTSDVQPPPGDLQAPTVLNQLTGAGVPWAYDYTGNRGNITPLGFHDVNSNPCEVDAVTPFSALPRQLAASVPPAVVFIDPSHEAVGANELSGFSEHPPDNVTLGADWTTAVVNAIFSSPVGPSSAVLLFYDEAGGYWDPVPPPVENGSPDGFRVPFLVISDFTPQGVVVDEELDPAAVLAFIDWNWRLPPLSGRVAASPGLGAFFAFDRPSRLPLLFPTPLNLTSLTDGATGAGVLSGRDSITSLYSRPSPSPPSLPQPFMVARSRTTAAPAPAGGWSFILRSTWSSRVRAGGHAPNRGHRHGTNRPARSPECARRAIVSPSPRRTRIRGAGPDGSRGRVDGN